MQTVIGACFEDLEKGLKFLYLLTRNKYTVK